MQGEKASEEAQSVKGGEGEKKVSDGKSDEDKNQKSEEE